jgi:hypothetical protein
MMGGKRHGLAARRGISAQLAKQRKLAIGPYPRVSLRDARTRRDEAKRLLDAGLDPSQQKRLAKLAATTENANTFAAIADELLELKRREGKSPTTLRKLEWLFRLAKPVLGARPISAIEAPEVLQVLRSIEARDHLRDDLVAYAAAALPARASNATSARWR